MKKRTNLWQRFLLVMLALSASIGASAYDFTATSNGKTIYYNITGTNICEVTKNTAGSYSGGIVIPSTVMNGSTQYTVTGIGILSLFVLHHKGTHFLRHMQVFNAFFAPICSRFY